jgi:hypothetical protein
MVDRTDEVGAGLRTLLVAADTQKVGPDVTEVIIDPAKHRTDSDSKDDPGHEEDNSCAQLDATRDKGQDEMDTTQEERAGGMERDGKEVDLLAVKAAATNAALSAANSVEPVAPNLEMNACPCVYRHVQVAIRGFLSGAGT